MNCHDFENAAIELVRGTPAHGQRNAALQHAAECATCARRLADERALSAGLHALASEDVAEAAAPRVEGQLLQAFRMAGQTSPSARSPWTAWTPVWKFAFAAVVVFAIAATAWFIARRGPAIPVTPTTARTPPQISKPALPATAPDQPSVPVAVAGNAAAERHSSVRQNRRQARMPVPRASRPDDRKRAEQAPMTVVATDFFAVPYAPPLPSGETVSLVRTRVPRSTMVTFGLPLADGRVNDLINADVLVGEDGMARAIRFVRDDAQVVQGGGRVRAVNANATR